MRKAYDFDVSTSNSQLMMINCLQSLSQSHNTRKFLFIHLPFYFYSLSENFLSLYFGSREQKSEKRLLCQLLYSGVIIIYHPPKKKVVYFRGKNIKVDLLMKREYFLKSNLYIIKIYCAIESFYKA